MVADRTPPRAPTELDRLLGDGLDRYRYGDIDGALETWERAAAIAPLDRRASDYVEYVRAHYELLAPTTSAPMAEHLLPFGLAGADDSADYHVEIELPPERLAEPSVEDGWWLSAEEGASATIELDAELPPRPAGALFGDDDDATTDYASMTMGSRASQRLPLPRAASEDSGEATFDNFRGRPPGPLELDIDLSEPAPSPPPPRRPNLDYYDTEPSAELTIERGDSSRVPTMDMELAPSGSGAARGELPGIGDLTLDLDPPAAEIDPLAAELELGIESSVPAREQPVAASISSRFDTGGFEVEELRLPPPPGRTQPVDDDDDAQAARAAPMTGGISAQLSAEADRGRRAGESTDDVARRRITWLIDRARAAVTTGDHDVMVAAIDLALSESPDSAVAQKLVHRHRDALLDCYYRYLGSLERRPMVTADLTRNTGGGLDPRAAFLLSRIDGMLTYDELLDVAGMGRLEACRHLVALVGRGLVRSGS